MFSAYAISTPGLEQLTADELRVLGIVPLTVEPGGVAFECSSGQLYAANLHLRTASRVIVRIAEFRARTFPELERHAVRIPWSSFIMPQGLVSFHVTSRKSKLYHHRGIAERLGMAIAGAVDGAKVAEQGTVNSEQGTVNRERGTESRKPGTEPGVQVPVPDSPSPVPCSLFSVPQLFVVRVLRDVVTISADASGELLHRRGYRLAVAKAPLRETLAAAMLAGVAWNGTTPLVDPFCGSGTVAIEAALLARRIPPGWQRTFAFERWPEFDEEAWRKVRRAAESERLSRGPAPIVAGDRDAGAIKAAQANALRAGVADDIEFQHRALSRFDPGLAAGTLLTNPPYGMRMGETGPLRNLFASLGYFARRRLSGWTVGWLSASARLDAATELPFAERFQTTNGGIRVRLLVSQIVQGDAVPFSAPMEEA